MESPLFGAKVTLTCSLPLSKSKKLTVPRLVGHALICKLALKLVTQGLAALEV
jgi:hypothetical protein